MNKQQKLVHDQRVVNSLNSRIEDLDKQIANANWLELAILEKARKNCITRLMSLYGTEKYSRVV